MSALLDDDKSLMKYWYQIPQNKLIIMLKQWKGGNTISQEPYDSLYPTAECTPKMY